MMKSINEAYATIQHAPLRYASANSVAAQQQTTQSATVGYPRIHIEPDSSLPADRLEFWVRFVCGAFLGVFASFALMIKCTYYHLSFTMLGIVSALLIVGCGLGAAYGGDRFWYRIFGVEGW